MTTYTARRPAATMPPVIRTVPSHRRIRLRRPPFWLFAMTYALVGTALVVLLCPIPGDAKVDTQASRLVPGAVWVSPEPPAVPAQPAVPTSAPPRAEAQPVAVRETPAPARRQPVPAAPTPRETRLRPVTALGSQATVDRGKLVTWMTSPTCLIAGHDSMGWAWLDNVPTGRRVVVLTGPCAGTYKVVGHRWQSVKGGPVPSWMASYALILQTCTGRSGMGFSLLQRA